MSKSSPSTLIILVAVVLSCYEIMFRITGLGFPSVTASGKIEQEKCEAAMHRQLCSAAASISR